MVSIDNNTIISIDKQSTSTAAPVPVFVKRRAYYHKHSKSNNVNDDTNDEYGKQQENVSESKEESSGDSYSTYRRLCETRMRRLERYKKARSFCSLHDENGNNYRSLDYDNDNFGNSDVNAYDISADYEMSENNNNYFTRSQQHPQKQTRYQDNGFDNNTRIASSSCSHLYANNNNNINNNNFSTYNSNTESSDFKLFGVKPTSYCFPQKIARNNDSNVRLQPATSDSDLLHSITYNMLNANLINSNAESSLMRLRNADPDSIFVDLEEPSCSVQNAFVCSLNTIVDHSPSASAFDHRHIKLPANSKDNNNCNNIDAHRHVKQRSGNSYCISPSQTDSTSRHIILPTQNNENGQKHVGTTEYGSRLSLAEQKPSPLNIQFEMLREKMISIMENDVQLLKKLLTLGETIQEIRSGGSQQPTAANNTNATKGEKTGSLEEAQKGASNGDFSEDEITDEFSDKWYPMKKLSHLSTVTRLYVGNDDGSDDVYNNNVYHNEDDVENTGPQVNVQYFSRKNSVLRIPIPPRSSNRMLGKRMTLRPSELLRYPHGAKSVPSPKKSAADADSGNSSASNTPPAQYSPNGSIIANAPSLPHAPTPAPSLSSTQHNPLPSAALEDLVCHRSQKSPSTTSHELRCDDLTARATPIENKSPCNSTEQAFPGSAERAISALRSELNANFADSFKVNLNSKVKPGDTMNDSGRSTLIQYSSSSSASDCASTIGGSSRYSTFSSESFSMANVDNCTESSNVIVEETSIINYDNSKGTKTNNNNNNDFYNLNEINDGGISGSTIVINMNDKCELRC